MELIGPYLIACGLLVAAGVAKAFRPADTARALVAVFPVGLKTMTVVVGVGSVAEAALGAIGLVLPRSVPATLVAVSYAAFAVFVTYALYRGRSIASCGCFGRPDTPATAVHVAVNLLLCLSAVTIAWDAPSGWMPSVLVRQPMHGWPLLLVSAIGAWLVYLVVSGSASLVAARRMTAVTFERRG